MLKDWKGDIAFTDKIAAFRGSVAENKRHTDCYQDLSVLSILTRYSII
jgi:hypothetical protein